MIIYVKKVPGYCADCYFDITDGERACLKFLAENNLDVCEVGKKFKVVRIEKTQKIQKYKKKCLTI